mgnify:CR=1 FL=1
MEQRTVLALGLDPQGIKQGAQDAAQALNVLTKGAEEAAQAVDDITAATEETKEELVVLGKETKTTGEAVADFTKKTTNAGAETKRSFTEAADSSGKLQDKLFSLKGVGEILENRLLTVGKAAIGMFGVDVAARVFGFNGLMDAVQQGAQAAAEAIKNLFKVPESDATRMVSTIAQLRTEVERLRDAASEGSITVGGKDANLGQVSQSFSIRPFNGDLEFLDRLSREAEKVRERILTAQNAELARKSGDDSLARSLAVPGSINRIASDFNAATKPESVIGIINEFETVYKGLVEEFTKTRAAVSALNGDLTTVMRVPFDGSRDTTPNPNDYRLNPAFAGSADTDPNEAYWRINLASMAQDEAAREAERAKRARGFISSFYGSAADAGLGELQRQSLESQRDFGAMSYRRGKDAKDDSLGWRDEYSSALNERYSTNALAEEFSGNLYNSLKYSLLNRDFSQFGESVVQLIGSSLLDALIATPFQEAAAAIAQTILSALRNAFGAGGATPATAGASTGGEANKLSIGNNTTTRSTLPFRSQRQARDDYQRNR